MSELLVPHLLWIDIGVCEYRQAWALQQKLHALCVQGVLQGVVLMVQHPAVITLGRHANREFILATETELQKDSIDVVPIDRGGEVTVHNPGQLVVYPILNLREFRLTPKKLVYLLEDVVIATLKSQGILGERNAINPGVWVGRNKICALGIRIRERVSLHGLALNVCNDLNLFNKIIPCGIVDHGVTSIVKELDYTLPWDQVTSTVVDNLKMHLDTSGAKASIIPSANGEWILRLPEGKEIKI